jgi:signal transduction histidine kinase
MSNLKQKYQLLHRQLTLIFSLCALVLIALYTALNFGSTYIASRIFQQNIAAKFPVVIRQYDPATQQVILQETYRKQRPDALALIVNNQLQQFTGQLHTQLLIFDFIIWLGATILGYFLTGKLLQPARRQAEKQAEFIANASHELKTPITTIKTELELLRLSKIPPHVTASCRVITHENQNLWHIVDKLLLTLQQQHTPNRPTTFDPVRLITEKAAKFNKFFATKHLQFTLTAPPKLLLTTDAHKLGQVLDLLLDNAGKYSTPRTTIHIRAQVASRQLQIRIINQGIGINRAYQAHIFDRFYRVADQRVQAENGSGLGLAIAQELIHDLSGQLTLISGQPAATTFQITIPAP